MPGVKPSALAAECDQVLMVAMGALHPHESVLQSATLEEVVKLLLNVQWQCLAVTGHHVPEFWVISFNNLI